MPKVSIIVPVYNVESYLQQCIDSITNQTLQDIEIILVDDGSTDKGGMICDEYAKKDNRIIVIHKENQGLSSARNDGIEASSAPYIQFVDADDWVNPYFCEAPYREAMQNSADLVLFSFVRVSNDGKKAPAEIRIKTGLLKEQEAIRLNILGWNSAWLALYRRELFDEVKFPVGKIFEDVGTSHKLIHIANRICFLNEALYNHRIERPGSITCISNVWKHTDTREMTRSKVDDLYNWGYINYAQMYAFHLLMKYGSGFDKQLDIIVKQGAIPQELSWKRKVLLTIFVNAP